MNKLIEYIKRLDKFYLEIGGIKFPRYVYYGSTKIDVEKLRNRLLKKISKSENDFLIGYLKTSLGAMKLGFELDFEQQFPIPIEDRDLWKDLCRKHKCSGPLPGSTGNYEDRSILFLDAYIMKIKADIEVDYLYTHPMESADLVRDEYLFRKYGISVLRVKEYSTKSPMENLKIFREVTDFMINTLQKGISLDYQSSLDFSNSILEIFIKEHKEAFDIIQEAVLSRKSPVLRNYPITKEEGMWIYEILQEYGITTL